MPDWSVKEEILGRKDVNVMGKTTSELSKEQIEEVIGLFNPYMDDYLYIMDLKNDSYTISRHACERFMLPSDSFQDAMRTHLTFVYEEDRSILADDLRSILNGEKQVHNLHYRWLDKNGMPIWINCRGCVLHDEEGEPSYLIGCINETGKKQRADNTSGLLGELELSDYLLSYDKKITSGFFMHVGIDDFNSINGTSGVTYGEYIIKHVAACITKCLSDTQHLFHIVSGEYMIVDFENSRIEEARALYEEIRRKVSDFIDSENYKSVFTVSAGIVVAEILVDSGYEEFLKLSDFALEKARSEGNNSFYSFEREDYVRFLRKRELTMALYHAVDNDFRGFDVHYQPIVDIENGDIIGAEALMRFSIVSGNTVERIAPFEFIPILEETGLILPAGRWILREAVAMCAQMQKEIPNFKINVNISYIQVINSNILEDIVSVIEDCGVSPEYVGIELTESGYLDSNSHFYSLRNGMRENGIPFIIDDFGTGYSNLHCLSDLSPTYIKIDRGFTNKAMNNIYDHELMVKIIEMAHSLDFKICVEGVEDAKVLDDVKNIHADYIQGYLFGRPCSKDDFFSQFVRG